MLVATVALLRGDATAAGIQSTGTVTVAGEGEWSVTRSDGWIETPQIAQGGTRVVGVEPGERIELQLPSGEAYVARQIVNESPPDLPIGSTFDPSAGTFYWQPAAGFLGAYDLECTAGTRIERVRIIVR